MSNPSIPRHGIATSQPAGWLERKASYASGLFKTIVTPAGVSFLPIVIVIVPTNVPMATNSAVIPAMSLVTLLTPRTSMFLFVKPVDTAYPAYP